MLQDSHSTTQDSAITKESGKVGWKSPSNIAIIKYWGKYGDQLPKNPSISFTLSKSLTETEVRWKKGSSGVDVYFEGARNEAFAQRLRKVVTRLEREIPVIKDMFFEVHTKNTFPHSAGIASSASALSAFALCLCSIEQYYVGGESHEAFLAKASHCSRLGSGSAARSVYGQWVEWGESDFNPAYSNEYALPMDAIHPSFHTIKDSILIISDEEKSVSSSVGHKLMEENPYATIRFQQAKDRIQTLSKALKEGDWDTFGHIAESEALTLHSLMMSSRSSYILMRPNSITAVEKIRSFRKKTGLPIYFTLDAGPNLHVLYPASIEAEAKAFISSELAPLCTNNLVIYDEIGSGPENFITIT